MKVRSKEFIPLTEVALDDPTLGASMKALGDGLSKKRRGAVEKLAEFEQLRRDARDIKNHTLDNLATYLTHFEEKVIEQGGTVHWATDDVSAREIVVQLCKQAGAKTVTKSKSMVTEEIELLPALTNAGIETVETDLGEYIIQLRGEQPSHIIAPAIHLNKTQVGDTFFEHHQKLGYNEHLTERRDIIDEARQVLRSKFLSADVGISGANFLVAETGSIVLVTNEGNAELTTSLPGTHIVVTGIEKVVPTLEDTATFIRLLGRSAAGMEISAYTSFITGGRREEDADGPDNFHVVLVDNGRSEMLGGAYREMLRCIRCSACLNHCPVYTSVGGHAYGSVYSGPMGAVLTPQLAGLSEATHLPNASTFCGRCEEVCPVMIPLPNLMRQWRNDESRDKLSSSGMRFGLGFWRELNRIPALYRLVTNLSVKGLRLFAWLQGGKIRWLPGVLGNWTRHRDLPVPARESFIASWVKRKA